MRVKLQLMQVGLIDYHAIRYTRANDSYNHSSKMLLHVTLLYLTNINIFSRIKNFAFFSETSRIARIRKNK